MPFNMNYNEDFISKENIEKIHEMTLQILEDVGIIFEDERALDALKTHGAKIDGQIAHIPRFLVEKALKTAPSYFTLRNKDHRIKIGDGAKQFRLPWGLAIYTNDRGNIRKMNNYDMMDFLKLTDSSPVLSGHVNFNLHNRQSYNTDQYDYGHLAVAYKYCNKPCFVTGEYSDINKFYKCFDIIRQFNGMEKIQNDQVAILRMNPLSPLCFDKMGVQFVLAACDLNQPVMIAPCSMPGLTNAPTVAGTLAVNNAEILGGLTLTQVISPGTPVLYGNTSVSSDLRYAQLSLGAPETALIAVAATAQGRYYNLPTRSGGALTDAITADYQAGAESAYLMNATLASKPDWVFHVCGLLGSMNLVSKEKHILDEENFLTQQRFQQGINFNDDQFVMDMIKKVGPRGSYLKIRSSKIFRDNFYVHKTYNKKDPNRWVAEGSHDLYDIAYEKAQKRISDWTPPQIDKEQEKILAPYLPDEFKNEI